MHTYITWHQQRPLHFPVLLAMSKSKKKKKLCLWWLLSCCGGRVVWLSIYSYKWPGLFCWGSQRWCKLRLLWQKLLQGGWRETDLCMVRSLATTFKCKAAQDPVTGIQKDASRVKQAKIAISENRKTEALSCGSVKVWLVWLSKWTWDRVKWLLPVSALEIEENTKEMR